MKAWGITDVGLLRHENQDTFAIEDGVADGQIIAVVCDGMGGVNGGRLASSIAVHTFSSQMHELLRADMTPEQLREAASFCVAKANEEVYRCAQEHESYRGMGTTLVAAVTYPDGAIICNVGDSRAYLIGADGITRITRDHSVVEGLIESGNITPEEARSHPDRHLITRALGPDPSTLCDIYDVKLVDGKCLLLCSDGLVDTATDEEICSVLKHDGAPEQRLEELIRLSKEHGAPDNITAIVLCDHN